MDRKPITVKEAENSYIFKVIKKIILQEYSFIKNLKIDSKDINEYLNVYIVAEINPYELQMLTGWPFAWYMRGYLERGEKYVGGYLKSGYIVEFDTAKELSDEIENRIEWIYKTPAIPEELKLPKGRHLHYISNYEWIMELPEGYKPIIEKKPE